MSGRTRLSTKSMTAHAIQIVIPIGAVTSTPVRNQLRRRPNNPGRSSSFERGSSWPLRGSGGGGDGRLALTLRHPGSGGLLTWVCYEEYTRDRCCTEHGGPRKQKTPRERGLVRLSGLEPPRCLHH